MELKQVAVGREDPQPSPLGVLSCPVSRAKNERVSRELTWDQAQF